MTWTFLATNPIGNVGAAPNYTYNANPGTGYGAGGTSSLGTNNGSTANGAAGRPGIVYVLRY